jgi:integron integrase
MDTSIDLMGPLQSSLALQPKLIPRLREALRVRHYSLKTEKSYVHWIKRFIYFHEKRNPKDMGAAEVTAFLNHLANERRVSASTQNQALSALLFLYREVLQVELPWLNGVVRAKTAKRLPTVLSRQEVQQILGCLTGTRWLMVCLLYGAGLRLNECLSLRIKDVDLENAKLIVRQGKGNKDRVTLLPKNLITPLATHLEKVKALHASDLLNGLGEAPLPLALAGKYPNAGLHWGWQFVFPSAQHCSDPYTGRMVRFHVHEKTLQRAVKNAARQAQVPKPVGCHTFRHAFATHLLEAGHNIRVVQQLMGHKDVETTMTYTHVMSSSLADVNSPADMLLAPR